MRLGVNAKKSDALASPFPLTPVPALRSHLCVALSSDTVKKQKYDTILDTTQYKDLLGNIITDIVLAVLAFGAQLEVDTKSQAQAEGIAAAHLKGVKFGRPKVVPKEWDTYYPMWKRGEITATECFHRMEISATTFYRLVKNIEDPKENAKELTDHDSIPP